MLVALVQQGEREATLSSLYGGQGDDSAGANPLYEAIGNVRPTFASNHRINHVQGIAYTLYSGYILVQYRVYNQWGGYGAL